MQPNRFKEWERSNRKPTMHLQKPDGTAWCGQQLDEMNLVTDELKPVRCDKCLLDVWADRDSYPDFEALRKRVEWYIATGD